MNDSIDSTERYGIDTIKYSRRYMIFLIVLLSLAHILDEYATLAPAYIRSSILNEYLVNTGIYPDLESATAFFNSLGIITLFLAVFATVFKSYQDRYGRKIIFIISAAGMTIGTLITVLSNDFNEYFIGFSVMSFFLINDMHYVFINEEVRANKRAQVFSYVKIAGLISLLAVPWLRNIFITDQHKNWKPILFLPIIVGSIVIILSILFLKETRAYVIMKSENKHNDSIEKINLLQAWRDARRIPTWHQIKWIFITTGMMIFFVGLNQNYNEVFMEQQGISERDKNIIITYSIIFVGVAYFIQGIITDRIGRRPSYIINSIMVAILLPIEYYVILNERWILSGIIQGLRIGAFWNITDVNRLMLIENTPTRMRGNIQAIQSLILFSIYIPLISLQSILIERLDNVFLVLMIFGIPTSIISAYIVYIKLNETVQVDITKISDQ